jgi:hypothetical protein
MQHLNRREFGMSHITAHYIEIVRKHAAAGHDVCEHYGDSYVYGNSRTGFELFKNKELQGRFSDAGEAMMHLDIIATPATSVKIGRD